MMEISFERADSSQADLVIALTREFYAFFPDLIFDEAATPATMLMILGDESLGQIWLIESDREIVGYIVLTFGISPEFFGRFAYIDMLYIRERFRGLGVGRKAVAMAEELCRSSGFKVLLLEVDRENTAAMSLYMKSGFKPRPLQMLIKRIETNTIA